MDLQLGITHSYHSNSNLLLPLMELQHLFDKVVTPSDVGKLNRLVIPKQYAEKYFPVNPFVAERGTQLAFEEQDDHSTVITTGSKPKQWLFRYLYWSSSQSYVITKGWSRFVKEKRLDAGDTISFCRGYGGRLFIGWQRRRILLPEPAAAYPCIDFRAAVQIKPKRIRLFGVNLECFDQPDNGSGKVQEVVTVSTPESSVRWWIGNRQPAFIGLGFD